LFFLGELAGLFRCDLVVENEIVVEIKAVNGIMPVLFRNQVIAYLKASGLKTGLLVNFGSKSCVVKRISN
jgi:GxxExxY protein